MKVNFYSRYSDINESLEEVQTLFHTTEKICLLLSPPPHPVLSLFYTIHLTQENLTKLPFAQYQHVKGNLIVGGPQPFGCSCANRNKRTVYLTGSSIS